MQRKCSALCDNLTRKKPSDVWFSDSPLRRCLKTVDLTFIGVGSVIGVGLFVMTGELVRNVAGPAVILSFVLAATAALLSALCYAEFGCRIPNAGSAYLYTYVSLGEIWAFIVGWTMVLEYILAAAILARSCSEYINSVADGVIFTSFMENLATWNTCCLGRFPDILALLLSIVATVIVSFGARKTSFCIKVATTIALVSLIFIVSVGLIFTEPQKWTETFVPRDAKSILRAAGSLFFVFAGFDVIAVASEETANPRKSIPLSLVMSYAVSVIAYCGTAFVLALIIPSNGDLHQFAPVSEYFAQKTFMAGKYIVGIGGMFGTAGALLLTTFAASRVVFSIATDGLLFQWLAHAHDEWHIPVRTALTNGLIIGCLAVFFEVQHLMELLSIGTLIAFTSVAVSVLVTRYQPGVQSVTHVLEGSREKTDRWLQQVCCVTSLAQNNYKRLQDGEDMTQQSEIPKTKEEPDENSSFRASVAVCLLTLGLTGLSIVLTSTDISQFFGKQGWALLVSSMLGLLVVFSLMLLERQPKSSATFPFMVPLVPYLPTATIFVNVLLLVSLHPFTYVRFTVWMIAGKLL